MGPYGVDRAVHSMEFTDCENGLGKYSFSLFSHFLIFNHSWAREQDVSKLLQLVSKQCLLHGARQVVSASRLYHSFFTGYSCC